MGITRQFVIDTVAPACQHSVLERTLRLEDLYDADEIFLTGTAAEVIGASKIGDRVIGNGKVGQSPRSSRRRSASWWHKTPQKIKASAGLKNPSIGAFISNDGFRFGSALGTTALVGRV